MKPVMDNVFDEIDDAGREVLKKITIDDIDRKNIQERRLDL